MKLTVMLLVLFMSSMVIAEDFSFCKNQNSVITLPNSAVKVFVESYHYKVSISSNKKTVFIISDLTKSKDKYSPKIEITMTNGEKINLYEESCKEFRVFDLAQN